MKAAQFNGFGGRKSMNCEFENRCQNTRFCYRCFNESMLKLPEDKQRQKYKKKTIHNQKTAQADNSWEDLEDQVALKLNQVPNIKEARRSRASGALPFEKGDIVDSLLHPECKERKGSELKTGAKSMSIKKEWLEKAKEEVKHSDKRMCLPFRFKEDDAIYVIMDFEDLADLTQTAKAYIHEEEVLRTENNLLRKEIDQLKRLLRETRKSHEN